MRKISLSMGIIFLSLCLLVSKNLNAYRPGAFQQTGPVGGPFGYPVDALRAVAQRIVDELRRVTNAAVHVECATNRDCPVTQVCNSSSACACPEDKPNHDSDGVTCISGSTQPVCFGVVCASGKHCDSNTGSTTVEQCILDDPAGGAVADSSDQDADGIPDNNVDNCPGGTYNPDQADSDGDGLGDACDAYPHSNNNNPDPPPDPDPNVNTDGGGSCSLTRFVPFSFWSLGMFPALFLFLLRWRRDHEL